MESRYGNEDKGNDVQLLYNNDLSSEVESWTFIDDQQNNSLPTIEMSCADEIEKQPKTKANNSAEPTQHDCNT